MSSGKEVVIVGAGVSGCSIAYHLARRGVASTIVERESIGALMAELAVDGCIPPRARQLMDVLSPAPRRDLADANLHEDLDRSPR